MSQAINAKAAVEKIRASVNSAAEVTITTLSSSDITDN